MSRLNSKSSFFVEFRYSPIYDDQCHAAFDLQIKQERSYPDVKTITSFMKRLEKEWRKKEQSVFLAIQKYSGVKWAVKKHLCYVVGSGIPFSDPLTMPLFSPQVSIQFVSDTLCHELIHRNLMEPSFTPIWKKTLKRLKSSYPKDNENVLVHVLVHAIHEQIYLNFFTEERLKLDKRIMSAYPDYDRAWEIVERTGSKNIINTFLK